MKLSILFRLTRVALNLKQVHIAEKVGVSHVALSRFELGMATLSTKTLCKIAPHYFMNIEFIKGSQSNPFKSESTLIKFRLSDNLGLSDFWLMQYIFESSPFSSIKFLIPHAAISSKVKNKHIDLNNSVFAVAIKDSDNNMFLFRQQSASMMKGGFSIALLNNLISNIKSGTINSINVEKKKINMALWQKINNWHAITKKDISHLFEQQSITLIETAEIEHILSIRKNNIDLNNIVIATTAEEIKLINEFRQTPSTKEETYAGR